MARTTGLAECQRIRDEEREALLSPLLDWLADPARFESVWPIGVAGESEELRRARVQMWLRALPLGASIPDVPTVAELEVRIVAAEGAFHVASLYVPNAGDARVRRRRYAEQLRREMTIVLRDFAGRA